MEMEGTLREPFESCTPTCVRVGAVGPQALGPPPAAASIAGDAGARRGGRLAQRLGRGSTHPFLGGSKVEGWRFVSGAQVLLGGLRGWQFLFSPFFGGWFKKESAGERPRIAREFREFEKPPVVLAELPGPPLALDPLPRIGEVEPGGWENENGSLANNMSQSLKYSYKPSFLWKVHGKLNLFVEVAATGREGEKWHDPQDKPSDWWFPFRDQRLGSFRGLEDFPFGTPGHLYC